MTDTSLSRFIPDFMKGEPKMEASPEAMEVMKEQLSNSEPGAMVLIPLNATPAQVNKVLDEVHEAVNHPKHYNSHPSGVECITIIEHMPFNIGSVVKYLWRAGLKPNAALLEDYKKARFYLEREIERLEKTS